MLGLLLMGFGAYYILTGTETGKTFRREVGLRGTPKQDAYLRNLILERARALPHVYGPTSGSDVRDAQRLSPREASAEIDRLTEQKRQGWPRPKTRDELDAEGPDYAHLEWSDGRRSTMRADVWERAKDKPREGATPALRFVGKYDRRWVESR